jgi:aminocarboxymuconate-semialdehyde decarboxylase
VKIDLHTHILPRSWPDMRERYGYGGFIRLEHTDPCSARMMQDDKFFRAVQSDLWDTEVRLAACDRAGVDVQVLSTVPVMFSYWAKPDDALDLSRLLNDHIAEVVARCPRRFVGLGTLPMQAPELAARELTRCVTELGLRGAQIGTHVGLWNLDDDALAPVYATAEALGAALLVHPWDMLGQDRMARYWTQWLVGMPAETTLAICCVLMGGVVERYPRLRWCFAHGGGAFVGTLGRIEHGFHARPDLCQTRTTTSPAELARRIYVDALVHDEPSLRSLIERLGVARIAMGSDYPFPLGEATPGGLIESLADLAQRDKERLLSGTALELLGLASHELGPAHARAPGSDTEGGASPASVQPA